LCAVRGKLPRPDGSGRARLPFLLLACAAADSVRGLLAHERRTLAYPVPSRTESRAERVRRQGDRAYTALFEKVLWPTWDVAVRRRETRRHLLELERSQWLEPEVRERAELRSLVDLLTYAGREVP
jgi:hypothetical protein